MEPVYVYQLLQGGNRPVARISLIGDKLMVEAGQQLVARVVEASLKQPARISEREGDTVIKRMPRTYEEAVHARLKRNVPKPYFLSRLANPFPLKYTSTYSVSLLEPLAKE